MHDKYYLAKASVLEIVITAHPESCIEVLEAYKLKVDEMHECFQRPPQVSRVEFEETRGR